MNMGNPTESKARMLTLILSENQSHKCIRLAREKNIRGGMVTIGKGTVKSTVLNLLGIKSNKKEILNFLLKNEQAKEILDYFEKELQLKKPGYGIAYTTSVADVAGFWSREADEKQIVAAERGEEEKSMYKKLTIIVDRGMADDVMDIALAAGVRGGTILHGRGACADIATKLFGCEIEPEKELVMILTHDELIDKVVEALVRELDLDKPGKGVLYVEPILETRGLLE